MGWIFDRLYAVWDLKLAFGNISLCLFTLLICRKHAVNYLAGERHSCGCIGWMPTHHLSSRPAIESAWSWGKQHRSYQPVRLDWKNDTKLGIPSVPSRVHRWRRRRRWWHAIDLAHNRHQSHMEWRPANKVNTPRSLLPPKFGIGKQKHWKYWKWIIIEFARTVRSILSRHNVCAWVACDRAAQCANHSTGSVI